MRVLRGARCGNFARRDLRGGTGQPVSLPQALRIKMKIIPLLIATVVSLSSCQSFYRVDPEGTAVLSTNQFKLPRQIDGFRREYVRAFDGSGYDVGAGYNYYSTTNQAALTVYVMSVRAGNAPTRQEADSHFRAASTEIKNAHPGATVVSTSTINGHGGTGMLVEYRYDEVFAGSKQPVCSLLAVFGDRSRLLKYRLTGLKSQAPELKSALIQIVKAMSMKNGEH